MVAVQFYDGDSILWVCGGGDSREMVVQIVVMVVDYAYVVVEVDGTKTVLL